MKRLTLFLIIMGALALSPFVAFAADPDNYLYKTPVSITNSTGGTIPATEMFCVARPEPLNVQNLIDGGYLDADLLDAAAFLSNETKQPFVREDDCFWMGFGSVPDGTEVITYVYTGGTDNPQAIYLGEPSESIDVPDANSLDITSLLSLYADSVSFDSIATGSTVIDLTGGTVTEAHGFRVHTFTSSATITVDSGGTIYFLCVAGGGGAGGSNSSSNSSGGGGGGGVATGTVDISAGALAITVGAGGTGGTTTAQGSDGDDSSIGALTSCDGGGGGGSGNTNLNGRNGGSGGGGGGGAGTGTGGMGTVGQGTDGANGDNAATQGGGGGGAGEAGFNGDPDGGDGLTISVPSGALTVGGGGGGGASGGGAGSGGSGGGGNGTSSTPGANGSANTGGGGGGANDTTGVGGDGGSGIVVVWYRIGTCLICKSAAYSLWINGETLTGDVTAGGVVTTATSTGLEAGTVYDLQLTQDADSIDLYVDGSPVASTAFASSLDTTESAIQASSAVGSLSLGGLRVVNNVTSALDLPFEPAQVALTQTGSTGNAWTWLSSLTDQSAGSNDGVWTAVSNQASVSFDVGALTYVSLPAVATLSQDLPDVVGTIPSLSTATSTVDTFTGDDALVSVIEFTGLEMGTGWFLLALVIAVAAGIPLVRATAGWVGAVWLGFAMGVPAVLEWYGWAWVAIGGFLCFGAAGVSALMGKR